MFRVSLIAFFLIPGSAFAEAATLIDYVLQLPAQTSSVLVVETETATLHHHSFDDDGNLSRSTQSISIGQNGAGKQRSGDRRTPLGVYFVIEVLDTRNLNEKYGPVAFPLDYPNAWDTLNDRTGHGIWIHGVTPGGGPRPARDTDGCISLANDELLTLKPYLTSLQVPVIVTRRIEENDDGQRVATREQLLEVLTAWADSYRRGDWYTFLSLYAATFEHRGMSRDEWMSYRVATVGERRIDEFWIDDILLIAHPEEPDLYISRFRQSVREAGQTVSSVKRLYWRRSEHGNFEIVAEDNG